MGDRGSRCITATRGGRQSVLAVGTLAVALLSALCAAAPDASAVLLKLTNGATISYERAPNAHERVGTAAAAGGFDAALTNLDYNGGPVMPSNTNYAIYWDPPGAPAFPPDYEPGINRYFEDLAHDSGGHENTDSVAAQYNDAGGSSATYSSRFGGALIDEDPFPASGCAHAPICLTDEQIRAELVKFVSGHHLSTDLTHEYFLFTPEGVENCLTTEVEGAPQEACSDNVADGELAEYCAYHGNIALEGGGELIYASDPFVNGKNCDKPNHPSGKSSDSVLIGGLSQEHLASITDPQPSSAWSAFGAGTGDIADKCRTASEETEYGTPLGQAQNAAKYNQTINGHPYWYEQAWSNSTHQCLQRLGPTAEPPAATFTSEALTGTEMRFDATGSAAGSGVKYDWQFNDTAHRPDKASAVETQSPSLAHKFSAAEHFLVALTVLRSDGTSSGTARTIVAGDEGPTAAYSLDTATPRVGGAIEFDGSGSSDADGSVAAYRWNFGDYSEGTGTKPSHSYALPGAYTVTLTITDASGQTAAVSRTVQVEANKTAQSIAFTSSAPAEAKVGGPPYTASASATSGLAVTFSSASPAICSVSGSTVSFLATGTCLLDADQPGNAAYEPAPQATQSVAVGRGEQRIAFLTSPPVAVAPGGTYAVEAASSAGLSLSISSPTPAVCSVWHATVAFVGAGECLIVATQPGNADYEPAHAVQAVFVLAKASPPGEANISPGPPAESPFPPADLLRAADSRFASVSASVNPRTGAIAITESVRDPGTLSWRVTFANGRFGVFGARRASCTAGFELIAGRCRPARIVFAQGARTVTLPGLVSFAAKPSAPAVLALRSAPAHRRGLAVIVDVTFQSALGGAPVSHTATLLVRTRH